MNKNTKELVKSICISIGSMIVSDLVTKGAKERKMSKRKKIAKKNIEILDSGKIKLKKGNTIDIKPLIKASAEDAIIVPSINKIIPSVRSKGDGLYHTALFTGYKGIEYLTNNECTNLTFIKEPTTIVIVKPINKLKEFDYTASDQMGALLRQSTLGPVIKLVKDKWKKVSSDKHTNAESSIMFLPDIMIFLDSKGAFIKPKMVNVLIVGTPEIKVIKETINEKIYKSDILIRSYIISSLMDIFDAAICLGADSICLSPSECKMYKKNIDFTLHHLAMLSNSDKVKDNMESVNFIFSNDDHGIIFSNSMNYEMKESDKAEMNAYKKYFENKSADEIDDIDEIFEDKVEKKSDKVDVDDLTDDEIEDIKDNAFRSSKTSEEVKKRKAVNEIKKAVEEENLDKNKK